MAAPTELAWMRSARRWMASVLPSATCDSSAALEVAKAEYTSGERVLAPVTWACSASTSAATAASRSS